MWQYRVGHVIDMLRAMEPESVQMVVTSPPYWNLRTYRGEQEVTWPDGSKGCFGLEETVELYVEHTILILREIRRVLRKDGVIFYNIADSYAGSGSPGGDFAEGAGKDGADEYCRPYNRKGVNLKPKDMCMVPFRVALAAQADGFWVRDDIIWFKPNPMPSSVTDRTTKCHEYIFLFTKSERYYWDAEAVREKCVSDGGSSFGKVDMMDEAVAAGQSARRIDRSDRERYIATGRNIRSVWEIPTQCCPGAHFAVFPERIPELCIKAGSSEKGCCPKCRSPWVRVVECDNPSKDFFEKDHISESGPEGSMRAHTSIRSMHRNAGPGGKSRGVYSTAVTKGWQPSCKCGINEVVPCVILDPFCGSGTTLKVARRLGRHAIGIDISNEYREIADKRAMLGTPDILSFK